MASLSFSHFIKEKEGAHLTNDNSCVTVGNGVENPDRPLTAANFFFPQKQNASKSLVFFD